MNKHQNQLTFLGLCHLVRLFGGGLDARVVRDQELALLLKELVGVLLTRQQHLVRRLRHCLEEARQPLLLVLTAHA